MKPGILLPLLLTACLSLSYGQQASATQDPHAYFNYPPSAPADRGNVAVLIRDYTGAIHILETGLKNNWPLERYSTFFDETPTLSKAALYPDSSWRLVRQMLQPLNHPRGIWDERLPTNVEVFRVLERCRQQRAFLLQFEAQHSAKPQ